MASAIKDSVNNMLSALNLGSKKEEEETTTMPPSDTELKELKEKYNNAGQGHVLKFYDDLKPAEKGALYQQLLPIDPEHINKLADTALNPPKAEEADQ